MARTEVPALLAERFGIEGITPRADGRLALPQWANKSLDSLAVSRNRVLPSGTSLSHLGKGPALAKWGTE